MPDNTDTQLSNILNGQMPSGAGGSSLFQLPSGLVTVLTIGSIVVTVLSVVIMILYLVSLVRRWKVQTAILDIQKQVHEMNERQKAQVVPAPVPVQEEITTPEVQG